LHCEAYAAPDDGQLSRSDRDSAHKGIRRRVPVPLLGTVQVALAFTVRWLVVSVCHDDEPLSASELFKKAVV